MSIEGEEGSMTKDLSAKLAALRDELTFLALNSACPEGIRRWRIKIAAEKAGLILASLPAEQEPVEMPNLRQPLETSAAESWRVERVRQQTASAADPKRQQAGQETQTNVHVATCSKWARTILHGKQLMGDLPCNCKTAVPRPP